MTAVKVRIDCHVGESAHVEGDLAAAGLRIVEWLTDPDELFALSPARPT